MHPECTAACASLKLVSITCAKTQRGPVDQTVEIAANGLTPVTPYYYRLWTDAGYQSVVGQTKTGLMLYVD